jgi:hypothetical protein
VKRRPNLTDLRAARWADRALRDVRYDLATRKLAEVAPPRPPELPAAGRRGVEALLRFRRPTCLEGALVRQAWLAAHGMSRDVVIGVGSPSGAFIAHAWLDGERDAVAAGVCELIRLAP